MALVLKDRVKETTTTAGTGALTLLGASVGYQSFSVIGNGNTCYYAISASASNEWEVGIGTYSTTGPTLTRTTILSSSNSGSVVTLSAGTKDVYVVYPAEKAIYEEASGETLIDGGPITVVGTGVTSIPSLPAELGKFIGNVNSFAQIYNLNQNDGSTASADFVAYNDETTDGYTHFTDMGINSSNYTSIDYPIFTPGAGYVYHDGDDFFIGNQTANKDIVLFAGGVDTTDEAVRISGTDRSVTTDADVNVGGALDVTGAASFGSTVLLDQDPTLALQAATKQYVDNQVTAGLHIHEPVLVETTGNLTAAYTQGGTTFNITDISGTNTVTTSTTHGLSVNDQIWLTTTAGNGLSTNTAYFVYSTPAGNQLTLSLTFGGAQITSLTNASGLAYATRANSGVGALLTNSGAQAALTIDNVALSVGNRVMVRLQTNGAENGVYTVTTVGSGSTNWVLTRATDSNKVNPSDPNGVGTGDYYYTQDGDINSGDSHVLTTEPNTMIIGYTTLTYTQFSGAVTYTGGTNIDVTGQVISLTGTVAATNGGTGTNTVTTGDLLYGSATNTWSKLPAGAAYKSLVMNAGGTNVEWNAVALNQSSAISGSLGATNGGTGQSSYALGDTLYSSATNTLAKLAGNTSTTKQYLSQTGTGSASAAPSWATLSAADIGTGVLPAIYGGTGQSSYAVGDLVYADTTTTLAKLADVATGNVLLSGGTNTAPLYGKVGLGTHISGTLAVSNGGTGLSTLTANGVLYASTTSAFSQSANLTFNGTTLSVGGLSDSGNLTFTGTGNRITGDMSNATLANRVAFQTSTTNGNTTIHTLPNGTATISAFRAFNNSDPTNASYAMLYADSTTTLLASTISGTGTYLPLTMQTGGIERLRIDTSGNVGIGLGGIAASGKFEVGGGRSWFTANSEPYSVAFRYNSGTGVMYMGATNSVSTPSIQFSNSGGAALATIDYNGNVGIGTTSPAGKLSVVGTSYLNVATYATGYALTLAATAETARTYQIGMVTGGALAVYDSSAATERMRIDSSGNVGIGTTSPNALLTIASTAGNNANMTFQAGGAGSGSELFVGQGADNVAYVYNRAAQALVFATSNITRMTITSAGGLAVGASGTNYGVQNAALISNGNAPPSYSQVASLGSFFYQNAFMGGF